jgi:hypothetical protein
MAALQGHFLKYKDDVHKAVGNYKELLEIPDNFSAEMPISEWFNKFNN